MHTFKADERNRQQVIRELQQKLELVEQAITLLTKSRKCVENNASMMKANVVQDISDVLTVLRSREVNLLRQIDVMEARHLNILHTQYAEVHQILGNLKHVLHCVEKQQDSHAHTFSDSEMELVEMVLQQKVPQHPITYSRDIEEFNAAIQHFGVIASNLSTLQVTKDLVSQCLPSKLEEYGDDDQQLLYKTLEEIDTIKNGRSKDYLKFPKLSENKEDWLRRSPSIVQASPAKPEFVYPDCFLQKDSNCWLRQAAACPKPPIQYTKEKKVEEWLRQIRHKNAPQSERDGEKVEPVAEKPRDGHRLSVTSESIEMISHPETLASDEFCFVPRNVSYSSVTDSDFFKFLKQPAQSPQWNSKEGMTHCCQAENRYVDIENLHTISCSANGDNLRANDNSKWLLKANNWKKAALERSFSEMLQLGGICCANEPCSSLRDCVCKEECTHRASEMQAALDKNSAYLLAPKMDEPTWLRVTPSTDEKCKKWCMTVATSQAEKMDLSEKKHKDDASNMSISGLVQRSDDKESWLTNSTLEDSEVDSASPCIRADFQSYFLPVNVNTWLVPAKA